MAVPRCRIIVPTWDLRLVLWVTNYLGVAKKVEARVLAYRLARVAEPRVRGPHYRGV